MTSTCQKTILFHTLRLFIYYFFSRSLVTVGSSCFSPNTVIPVAGRHVSRAISKVLVSCSMSKLRKMNTHTSLHILHNAATGTPEQGKTADVKEALLGCFPKPSPRTWKSSTQTVKQRTAQGCGATLESRWVGRGKTTCTNLDGKRETQCSHLS